MRFPGSLVAPLVFVLAACAGGTGGAWRDTAPADPGPLVKEMPMDAALASLHRSLADGAKVTVSEVRWLGIEREPWPTLDADEALRATGPVGLIAKRVCRRWDGVRRTETDRASWYVFHAGRLHAFDHYEFEADCGARNVFQPSPPEEVATERTLVRFVAQRYPRARGTVAEGMEKGLRFVAVGRLDDAEAQYDAGTRSLEDIVMQRKMRPGVPDPVLDQREAELRPLHRQLHAELLEARRMEQKIQLRERELRRLEREAAQADGAPPSVSAAP